MVLYDIHKLAHWNPGYVTFLQNLVSALGNASSYYVTSAAGLAIGSVDAAEILIGNTVQYFNGAGQVKTKTTAEIAFTATTHDIAANASAAQEAWYLVSLDSAGTATITKGTTAAADSAVLPAVPSGDTAIGGVKISVAAGATPFDATSDDLDAAHLTTTYVDFVGPTLDANAIAAGIKLTGLDEPTD